MIICIELQMCGYFDSYRYPFPSWFLVGGMHGHSVLENFFVGDSACVPVVQK